MSEFDSIIAETNERFDINGKGETLVSAVSALMTDEARGGLANFLDKFNQIGLSDATSSWIDTGANIEVSTGQIESALGTDTLHEITNQAATDYDTSMAAIAFMIPHLVDALTPDGIVPPQSNLITETDNLKTGGASATSETFDRIGTTAVPATEVVKRNTKESNILGENVNPNTDRVDAGVDKIEPHSDKNDANPDNSDSVYDARNNSPLAWILPLLLLGLLLTLGYWFCSKTPSAINEQTSILNER